MGSRPFGGQKRPKNCSEGEGNLYPFAVHTMLPGLCPHTYQSDPKCFPVGPGFWTHMCAISQLVWDTSWGFSNISVYLYFNLLLTNIYTVLLLQILQPVVFIRFYPSFLWSMCPSWSVVTPTLGPSHLGPPNGYLTKICSPPQKLGRIPSCSLNGGHRSQLNTFKRTYSGITLICV